MIFPEVSVIAKGSCRDVKRAVLSIRDADGLHWLDAFGLVDNDRRPQAEINRLKEDGVYAPAVFSVECIYYHPEVQRRVAERHASTTGDDFNKCIVDANSAAIAAVTPHVQRLSERVAEKLVREQFLSHIPNRDQISAAAPVNISIDVPKIVGEERTRLQEAFDAADLTTIVSRYPVRETRALDTIAPADLAVQIGRHLFAIEQFDLQRRQAAAGVCGAQPRERLAALDHGPERQRLQAIEVSQAICISAIGPPRVRVRLGFQLPTSI